MQLLGCFEWLLGHCKVLDNIMTDSSNVRWLLTSSPAFSRPFQHSPGEIRTSDSMSLWLSGRALR